MRKRIYEIVDVTTEKDIASAIYDIAMIFTIVISILLLAFTRQCIAFEIIDKATVIIFIIDYVLRLVTADYKLKKKGLSFIIYPFTPMAIIDLLSILPSLTLLNSGLRLLKVFRLFRSIRVLRVFKAARYSKNIQLFINVFKKQRDALITIIGIAVLYILISALVVLNIEPDTFGDYFHAVYWATVSLTTVGYGDIYPTSVPGQVVTMISSFVGIAIVAMPAGVITAGFMDELDKKNKSNSEE